VKWINVSLKRDYFGCLCRNWWHLYRVSYRGIRSRLPSDMDCRLLPWNGT